MLIVPGGGYNYVVVDKEGSEAAEWLNKLGVTAFVLRYRTKQSATDTGWQRALQDAQRSLSLIRSNADDWKLDADRIGILGFSAGGQVAALAATVPVGRLGSPRDAGAAVAFLASDEAGWITGQTLGVNGGSVNGA